MKLGQLESPPELVISPAMAVKVQSPLGCLYARCAKHKLASRQATESTLFVAATRLSCQGILDTWPEGIE